ncbi:MAG: hypothetical protein RQ847_11560 [Wenzhouxiangellaceae bacterium]|nr:hypothetical protein [Wenzhouxiangellaceae bacterium]
MNFRRFGAEPGTQSPDTHRCAADTHRCAAFATPGCLRRDTVAHILCFVKNITLSVDEKVLAAVRRVAANQGTTVNAIVREHLTRLAEHADRAALARKKIRELSEASDARIGSATWRRDELHEN